MLHELANRPLKKSALDVWHRHLAGENTAWKAVPHLFQRAAKRRRFTFLRRLFFGQRRNGEDTPVDAAIADLGLVRNAAEGDDGPVFKLERRDHSG